VSPFEGEHGDFFKNTFEESRGMATQHATSYKAIMLRLAQGRREVTPSSGN
jgi:hypothetical protein